MSRFRYFISTNPAILYQMNREQLLVKDDEVKEFLNTYYSGPVEDLVYVYGGKHSEAFSYTYENKQYILRFNESERGFLKDKYAYDTFSSENLVIPKIYDVGKHTENVYYCISEKIEGETPKDAYKRGDFTSLSLQFEMIERIKDSTIPEDYTGYDEIELGKKTRFETLEDYVMSLYFSNELFDWNELSKLPFFDQSFIDYLVSKVKELVKYGEGARVLLHGDFGNDNLFIKDGKVTGIIDWERLRLADHFLDVGRVVLFCPNREVTVKEVLTFYENKGYEHYKERIALGVYVAMIRNYGAAAKVGNEASCASAPTRIREFEELMEKGVEGRS